MTSLSGGPGLGKTTLLAQAIAENRLAPRGQDVWVGLEPEDVDADRFARVVATALADQGIDELRRTAGGTEAVEPATIADAVWRHAPTESCLVIDDVHLLQVGSSAATWLQSLVGALPANGHVVFAGRSEPPVRLTRLGSQGEMLRLGEDDLRFSEEELSSFAAQRGVAVGCFEQTGGWPAMAELAATVDQQFTGAYLWEEVLEPLGLLRRHVLAVLCDLGGADSELISAAVGTPVDLAAMLAGIPLVARGADGWYVLHALWRSAPGIGLDSAERVEVRRRAVGHLSSRGRFDEAFSHIQEAEVWDAAPAVLRHACLASDRLVPSQLGRWLSASPEAVRTSLAGVLASAMNCAFTTPDEAVEPLEEAVARGRAEGDVDAELSAIARLGQIAWWRQDLKILAGLATRVEELEATGHPRARSLAAFGRAVVADLVGDDQAVLAELAGIEHVDPAWEVLSSWLIGSVRLDLGDADAVSEIVARLKPGAEPVLALALEALQMRAWWTQGRVDDVVGNAAAGLERARRTGLTYNLNHLRAMASFVLSHAGMVEEARQYLDEAVAAMPAASGSLLPVHVAVATASLQVAEGDEAAATATLRSAIENHGLDQGFVRRAWRQNLPLTYVLLPETRGYWGVRLSGSYLRTVRDLATVTVALREGQGEARLRNLQLPEPNIIRCALHHRFAAELAVGLAAMGRPEARPLLDILGSPGRTAVRTLASRQPLQAKAARALLSALPAPPPRPTYLGVLGMMVMRRDGPDGEEAVDPELRRRRVRSLLAFLVGHRRTTRSAIIAALWPDLDDRSAANNLGVTLNRLLRLLEPWRESGEPAYLLRLDGPGVHLVTGEHLRVDIDDFDQHLREAALAEADGAPSVSLAHNLAAVSLYRDDLHADVGDADWLVLDREHYRGRFVGAAVRAGQLLLGRGDIEAAETVVQRALAVDPWAEAAYAVLVGAALARGHLATARRLLDRCLQVLSDLGVDPSSTTTALARRVGAIAA